ncbi:Ig-like domain-containing protein [Psychromonas sp. KJ10-10]|uniref:Ig-like domain-containing protein n=1 Tax=Psychromonas sp. KJ10-10 TaxID=3391823 RepID=UPI0039B5A481
MFLEDETFISSIDLDANDSDADGDALSVIAGTFTTTQGGTIVIASDGSYTYTPVPNYHGTDSVEYTVTDGALTDTGTLTINVQPVNDAPVIGNVSEATVSEEGLTGGIEDIIGNPTDTTNDVTYSGTFEVSDIDSSSLTATITSTPTGLTSAGIDLVYELSADGKTLNATAGDDGESILEVNITDNGTYLVTLLGALDHENADGDNLLDFDIGIQVSDGTDTASSSINITVEDDTPISGDVYQSLVIEQQNTNVMFIIDTSGSMGSTTTVDGVTMTRMELLLKSVAEVINSYDAMGDVMIQIVTFDSGTDSTSQANWFTVDEALAFIGDGTQGSRDSTLDPSGGTDYDRAVIEAKDGYDNPGKLVDTADVSVNNVSYFLSDGQPQTRGGSDTSTNAGGSFGITNGEITEWTDFLVANEIDSYAVGFGTGLDSDDRVFLDPLAYDGVTDTERLGLIVTDSSELNEELLSTVEQPVIGGLFGSLENDGFGADDGDFLSITVNGVTYTWDGTANNGVGQITSSDGSANVSGDEITFTTDNSGELTLNFETGLYSYLPLATMPIDTQYQETIDFVVVDTDGDQSAGTVTLNISRGIDSDSDGIINAIDIDDDNDGILDTIENEVTVTPFEFTTSADRIALSGSTSQTIDLSSYGVSVGDYVTISDITARGDINGDANNEYFTLTFNGSDSTGQLQTALNGGSEDNVYREVLNSTSYDIQVIDVNGVPSIVISGIAGSGVDNLNGINGVDYYFTISNSTIVSKDSDGDGIIDSLDTDSDNDGISDNIEAQTNANYITPTGVDSDHDGLDDAYETSGLIPIDSDSDGIDDYLDTDSDNDGTVDGKSVATSGDDRIVGEATVDTLSGLAGNDVLIGGDGDDFLIGGTGNDILTGGNEADTFVWLDGDTGVDHVTDFTASDGDVIDISDILHITDGVNLNDYLDFESDGINTTISVHAEGGAITQTIVLDGIDLGSDDVTIINDLLTGSNPGALFIGENVTVDSVTMEVTIPDETL